MWDGKFVISISGDGECGKDTAAPFFSKYLGIPYLQSTSACVVDPWWKEIQDGWWSKSNLQRPIKDIIIEPDYYPSKQDFHTDRRNRRMDWVAYIEHFNMNYGHLGVGLYAKAVEDGNQVLTGIRRTDQFQRCLDYIVDVAIWINRPGTSHDESQEYDANMCTYVIENDGTIEELQDKCKDLSYLILTDLEYGKHTAVWIENMMDVIDNIHHG